MAGQFALSSPADPAQPLRRNEHFEFSAEDLPALNMDLGPMSFVSVSGTNGKGYSFDVSGEIEAEDEGQGKALLQRLALRLEVQTLALKTPPNLEHVRSSTYVDVLAPSERPIVITGAYTAVELFRNQGSRDRFDESWSDKAYRCFRQR